MEKWKVDVQPRKKVANKEMQSETREETRNVTFHSHHQSFVILLTLRHANKTMMM